MHDQHSWAASHAGVTPWHLPPPDERVADRAYRAALAYLYEYSRTPRSGAEIRADHPRKLARMARLLALCGAPQHAYPAVLVAGTKGKGSTAAMLASVLKAGGLRVGRYTQPHLVSYRERTWVDGAYISSQDVVALTHELAPLVEAAERAAPALGHYTTFEVGTALSLLHFARAGVNLAVVEVGVGGAHDATNVLDPVASVIAPISADHLATIGPTLADVAREKAGVLRPGRPGVVAAQVPEVRRVLRAEARRAGAALAWVGRNWRWAPHGEPAAASPFAIDGPDAHHEHLTLPLLGQHQRENAALAVACAHALNQAGFRVSAAAIARGLARVEWPGRVQVLPTEPTVVVDGAHNAASAASLRATLADCFPGRALTLVLGCTADKDLAAIVETLAPAAARAIATQARHPRAADAASVARAVAKTGVHATVVPDAARALDQAMAATLPHGLVVVAGSLFLAGEALAHVAEASDTRE
ncbi:MAG TPA: Mur ligase family protein [Chloroflexota bacterium]|jgi:dihydrofolate synthase/folylpolyglutamate synthase